MLSEEIIKDIDHYVSENREELFKNIGRLIAIDSVGGAEEAGAPFGKGPAAALKEALKIAEELGLETTDYEGKMGAAYVPSGSGSKKYLATITHLDVVPAGNGWDSNPFEMLDRDGYIIGRGVSDDKGPSVLSLYALKYFKDRRLPLNYEIRALLGVNEETGMKDLEYYLQNNPAPEFCFSPDADFPLINGEKGIWNSVIVSAHPVEGIKEIKGGAATNAVCDLAEATVSCPEALQQRLESADGIELSGDGDELRIIAHGIGSHASMPEGSKNAIGVLAEYLLDNKLVSGNDADYLRAIMKLHSAYDGSGLGVASADEVFGPLTIIGGIIGIDGEGRMYQTVDSRFPSSIDSDTLFKNVSEALGEAAFLKDARGAAPFYLGNDDPAVKVCIDAYNLITGENSVPFTIGGITYARHFPKAAGFGPIHYDRPMPKWCGNIHSANEAASKADFEEALKIYIVTLMELERLEF